MKNFIILLNTIKKIISDTFKFIGIISLVLLGISLATIVIVYIALGIFHLFDIAIDFLLIESPIIFQFVITVLVLFFVAIKLKNSCYRYFSKVWEQQKRMYIQKNKS